MPNQSRHSTPLARVRATFSKNMNQFSDYRPVGGGERLLAFIGNLVLLGLGSKVLNEITAGAGLAPKEQGTLASLTTALVIVLFCVFPETPCKRLGRFRILTEEKEEIELKKRLWRMAPYLILALGGPLVGMIPKPSEGIEPIAIIVILPLGLTQLFILADGLTVFFHPEKRSLLDMKLGTCVMKPPPLPEHLKPRMLGRKII